MGYLSGEFCIERMLAEADIETSSGSANGARP